MVCLSNFFSLQETCEAATSTFHIFLISLCVIKHSFSICRYFVLMLVGLWHRSQDSYKTLQNEIAEFTWLVLSFMLSRGCVARLFVSDGG